MASPGLGRAQQQQGRAVGDRRTVGDGVQMVHRLQLRLFADQDLVEALGAHRGEHRSQAGQAGAVAEVADVLVVGQDDLAIGAGDRRHATGVASLPPGLRGAGMGGQDCGVQGGPRKAFAGGEEVGGDPDRRPAHGCRQRHVGIVVRRVGEEGHLGHAFDAAGEGEIGLARLDPPGRVGDRAESRDTEIVDGQAGHGVGQAGLNPRGQRDMSALDTDLRDAAQRQVVGGADRGRTDPAFQRADQLDHELNRANAGQGPIGPSLAAGRPDGVIDIDRHGGVPPGRSAPWSGHVSLLNEVTPRWEAPGRGRPCHDEGPLPAWGRGSPMHRAQMRRLIRS